MTANDWYISSLTLKNFRGYTNFAIDFSSEITLLIGENGAGKSAVLDALSIMLWTPLRALSDDGRGSRQFTTQDVRRSPADLDSQIRQATDEQHYPVQGVVDAIVDGTSIQWQREKRSISGHTTKGDASVRRLAENLGHTATEWNSHVTLPIIAAYGVERLIGEIPKSTAIPTSRRSAYDMALDPRSDVKRLGGMLRILDEQILRAQAFRDSEPTAAFRQFEAIKTACDRILAPVGWNSPRWDSTLDRITFYHQDHGRLPMNMLATGTKISAGLAIDLASRMARANPHLGANTLLQQTPGIVLIDEIDLHLHPKWQRQIVPALRQTFPRVQFIITTHSPQVISTVEAENIRILSGEDVTIPEYSEGIASNVALEMVQGTDSKPDVSIRRDLDHYMKLVHSSKGTTNVANQLRNNLDAKGGRDAFPELVDADTIIEIESWEE